MYLLKKLAVLAVLIPICSYCQANDERLYGGLKFGQIKAHPSSSSMSGIMLGIGFSKGFSAELQVIRGDFECCRGYHEYDYENTGLYLAYRTGDRIYRMVKLGVIQADADGDVYNRISGGIGLGFRLSNSFSMEGDILKLEGDLNFFGLTGRLSF